MVQNRKLNTEEKDNLGRLFFDIQRKIDLAYRRKDLKKVKVLQEYLTEARGSPHPQSSGVGMDSVHLH